VPHGPWHVLSLRRFAGLQSRNVPAALQADPAAPGGDMEPAAELRLLFD